MNNTVRQAALKLIETGSLSLEEYETLIRERDEEVFSLLREKAVEKRRAVYGNAVFVRGLIEIGNICKNDCFYCGIRRSNSHCERYRLSREEILSCTDEGARLGFCTFVLQGGEDPFFTDDFLTALIREIKRRHPDCAVTLSLGERSRESYRALFEAGADRYLLRHETADETHYARLHPAEMSYHHRMECLQVLRETGYQVGCGFMVGSPYQTEKELAKDLKLIETFRPDMCGIGPFIPHAQTPFADRKAGTAGLTCFLLSVIRLHLCVQK